MHVGQLTAPEQRVLGALIEKRWTTPDQYPLSLNALRLASNQLTNRDPVTTYDEAVVRDAAQRLSRYGLARLASGHTSRAVKYRHLAGEALSLEREELAVLAVLLLRGPQTPGEIKARTERMARFESLADVERALDVLCQRGYASNLGRRPGQKEGRFQHLLGASTADEVVEADAPREVVEADAPRADAPRADAPRADAPPSPEAPDAGPPAIAAHDDATLEARVAALEVELAELRQQIQERSGG